MNYSVEIKVLYNVCNETWCIWWLILKFAQLKRNNSYRRLVYDATMRFMNSNMNKIEYPIVVPVVS
nr:hypothetical protein [Mycoplasmopsis bovis]